MPQIVFYRPPGSICGIIVFSSNTPGLFERRFAACVLTYRPAIGLNKWNFNLFTACLLKLSWKQAKHNTPHRLPASHQLDPHSEPLSVIIPHFQSIFFPLNNLCISCLIFSCREYSRTSVNQVYQFSTPPPRSIPIRR